MKQTKRIVVIRIFSWSLLCQCSYSLSEPWPTPTSPGGPLIHLGRSLDMLWALWGWLRLWSGPPPTCTCPQSPLLLKLDQSQLWEHLLSIQIFHRQKIYQVDPGDLICGLCSCKERFPFLFLSCTTPGAQLWFWPHLCMCITLRHLFPSQARGSKSSGWFRHTCSLRPGRVRWPQLGCVRIACGSVDWQAVATDWGALVRVPPSACWGRGWHVGAMAALSLVWHSTMAPCFLGIPRFL